MHLLRDIIYRLQAGQTQRKVARDLGLSRGTVRKYHALATAHGYLQPGVSLPDEAALQQALGPAPAPPRQPSGLEPFAEVVRDLLLQGCEMMAILARLRQDHGYTGSYSSLRRYVHRVHPPEPRVTLRVSTPPGEEMQVDFGGVGKLYDPRRGCLRTAYAFVAMLSYSRHQYAELVFDQKVATWIACHRHAFAFWGGVPKRVVPDNLKAAVSKPLLHDPILGEAYRRMAQHYGFLISPTRPYTPRHKGKVESGVHYLQRNFMAGQQFVDIDQANARLREWLRDEAGTRCHGTTHQAPLKLFAEYEQAALLPLPATPFVLCDVRQVKVHPDCHVVIDGSYYSVPWRYAGQTVEAYIQEQTVQLYAQQTLLATHLRVEKGQHATQISHYPAEMTAFLERTPARCRELAAGIGSATAQAVEQLLADRPLDRLRSVQAILSLAESVGRLRLEAACARALYYGDVRYRRIKEILNAALDREPLPDSALVPVACAHLFARPSAEFFARATAEEGQALC
jgi:transposase